MTVYVVEVMGRVRVYGSIKALSRNLPNLNERRLYKAFAAPVNECTVGFGGGYFVTKTKVYRGKDKDPWV